MIKMKFIITVHLLCFFSVCFVQSDKTVTLSAPNCNFNMSITVPTTKCCCPALPPTVPPTQPPSGPNYSGCLQNRVYSAPTCSVENSQTFPGIDCESYYICKKIFNIPYAASVKCPIYYNYSIKQQKCVPKPTNKCCSD